MKRNDEDFFQFEKERNGIGLLKKIKITAIVSVLIFNFLVFISIFRMKSDYDFNKKILSNGKKYEKSLNLNKFGKTGKEMEEIGYEGKSH